jgi:hypothetical protein
VNLLNVRYRIEGTYIGGHLQVNGVLEHGPQAQREQRERIAALIAADLAAKGQPPAGRVYITSITTT